MTMIHINMKEYPVSRYLKQLLMDKSTKKNIIFATDSYIDEGPEYSAKAHMTPDLIFNMQDAIQPRITKAMEEQAARTRKKAEVFTPAWLCCKMNDHCDEEWFGRKDVFCHQEGPAWEMIREQVSFPEGRTWKQYVDSRRLEITCGEAPYIVSRYDAASGEPIPVKDRIGILDRKLRVVTENTENRADWAKWALRAYQSVYGYEFQGDSLLIARINLLLTYIEYVQEIWEDEPSDTELSNILRVIVWNIWQMDGLTGMIPFSVLDTAQVDEEKYGHQMTFFEYDADVFGKAPETKEDQEQVECRIYDWRSKVSVTYNSLKKG